MIDLPTNSILPPTPEQTERVMRNVRNEGKTSRDIGLPREKCPPYVHPGMTKAWLQGWDEEDARINRLTHWIKNEALRP